MTPAPSSPRFTTMTPLFRSFAVAAVLLSTVASAQYTAADDGQRPAGSGTRVLPDDGQPFDAPVGVAGSYPTDLVGQLLEPFRRLA